MCFAHLRTLELYRKTLVCILLNELYGMRVVDTVKDLPLKKETKVYSRFLIEKISEFFFILLSAFTLIMRVMTSPKNFEKIAILKI